MGLFKGYLGLLMDRWLRVLNFEFLMKAVRISISILFYFCVKDSLVIS